MPSLTTLTQEGAGLETVRLTGRWWVPASLHTRPATPVEGEAGGRGYSSCMPSLQPTIPGEGEVSRRGVEVHAGGGVFDRLVCWITSLLPTPARLGGGGAVSRGGARVFDPSL